MSPAAKMIIVLTAVGIISGGSLAVVYKGAEPKIEQQRIKTLKAARTETTIRPMAFPR